MTAPTFEKRKENNLTELEDKTKLETSDSQTVKVTDMTNIREIINEIHHNKITPPRDNYKYWSTNLPTVKGEPFRGKVTGKTEEEVYQKLAKFYGIHIIDENATLQDLFYSWYNSALEDGMERQTFERYEATFKKYYVRTNWNNRKIKNLSMQDWKYFIENTVRDKIYPMRGEKITKKEYGRLKDVTSAIIAQGRADRLIDYEWGSLKGGRTGIIGIIHLGKGAFSQPQEKDDVYYPHEMRKILDYCKKQEDPKADCIRLIAMTGMRIGEATALMHDDIDVANMQIYVNKTEVKPKSGIKVAHHTKTKAGMRAITVKDCHKEFLAELYFKSSSQPYVFINTKKNKQGKRGRIGTQAIRRYMKEVCKEVGVPYKAVHAIRKYYASMMEKDGVPDNLQTENLGQEDISTTKRFYHRRILTKQEKRQYINRVSGI